MRLTHDRLQPKSHKVDYWRSINSSKQSSFFSPTSKLQQKKFYKLSLMIDSCLTRTRQTIWRCINSSKQSSFSVQRVNQSRKSFVSFVTIFFCISIQHFMETNKPCFTTFPSHRVWVQFETIGLCYKTFYGRKL